ncbi:MAG: Sec-independent protein translocase TatA [Hyphomonadaceae bacterium]
MFGPGGISPIQLILVLALVLLFFGGRGKISAMMQDMAKGVRSFRKGLKEDDEASEDVQKLDDGNTINVTPAKDKTNA